MTIGVPDAHPAVSVIVPAYNEVERITATIDEIRTYFDRRGTTCQIVISADGNDGTRERAAEVAASDGRILVMGHRERSGKGRGIREAIPHCQGRLIGFVDADQKTPIEEFDKVPPLFDAGHDLVIGSRALRESTIERPQNLLRRVGSRGFGYCMRAIVGLSGIPDTQCGFKFFRREVAIDLFARQQIDGYMFDVEILSIARRLGYRIAQLPVRWRDDGDSRLRLVSGNVRNMTDLFKVRFRSRSIGRNERKDSDGRR